MIKVTNSVDTCKVMISGEIGESFWGDGYSFAQFKQDISGDFANIEVEIKSNGGDVFDALAIYDEMKKNPARICTKIVGTTASAGTIIAMGGDDIEITENSRFLIHRTSTVAMGNVDEMERTAEELASFDEQLQNIYQKRTGKRKSQIMDLMKQERWLTAAEAKEWGFVDRITKNKITNQITEMDTTKIKSILGVESDEQIEAAVQNLIDIRNQVDADKQAAVTAQLTTIVDKAIEDKKIKAESRSIYMNMGLETAKAAIEAIEVVTPVNIAPITNNITPPEPMTKEQYYAKWRNGEFKNKAEQAEAYKQLFGEDLK